MSKFNRKFCSACSRLAFWHELSRFLTNCNKLLKAKRNFTPDDVIALKSIHRKLYECYSLSKGRVRLHQERIKTLRKEIQNGNKTLN